MTVNYFSPDWVCSAHASNCWVISLPLSPPQAFPSCFSPPVLLRRGSGRVAEWGSGSQPRLIHHKFHQNHRRKGAVLIYASSSTGTFSSITINENSCMYKISKYGSILNVAIDKNVYLARKRDRGKKTTLLTLVLSQTFGNCCYI